MTWTRIDDGFPVHPKVRPLSDAAFRLHVTALCDCSRHLTDGRVSRDTAATLQGAPRGARLRKAIEELVSRGLWLETESGWEIHDFLEWNPSAEEVLARRATRAASGRLGGQRSGSARRTKRDGSVHEPTDEANAKQVLQQTGSKREAKTNPVPVPVLDPDLIAAAKDLSGSPRAPEPERPRPPLVGEPQGKIPCPPGLSLTADQRGTLETALVPGWAIDALTAEVVAGFQGDPTDHRPLAAWRKCLSRAISGRWNDPHRREELLASAGPGAPQHVPGEERTPVWRPPPAPSAVPCPPEVAARLRAVGYDGPLEPTGAGGP